MTNFKSKETKMLLKRFDVDSLDELERKLIQLKALENPSLCVVDTLEYNQMLKELNDFLRIQNELGADLVGFIKAFMEGDAFWAYNKEKHFIGEMKVGNPFESEIHVKPITPEEIIDKKKLN